MTTPTPQPVQPASGDAQHVKSRQITPSSDTPKKPGAHPTVAQQLARIQKSLNDQRAEFKSTAPGKRVQGPLVQQPANAARLAAILHIAAMDLWDVATEQDAAQMWEEARAIASRILAACPTA